MIQWIVEFEGRHKPLDDIWSPELAAIVGPLRDRVTAALDAAADPDELAGLQVIVYAEGGTWGFRFAGATAAVHYAIALVGMRMDIYPTAN